MGRATVAIFFFVLTAAAVSAAQAPAESPKASTPAEAPEVALAKAPEAASAPASRKSGPAAAPTSKSFWTASASPAAGKVSCPPAPLAAVSPIADGPVADADDSGASALVDDAAIAIAAGVVVTVIFA